MIFLIFNFKNKLVAFKKLIGEEIYANHQNKRIANGNKEISARNKRCV